MSSVSVTMTTTTMTTTATDYRLLGCDIMLTSGVLQIVWRNLLSHLHEASNETYRRREGGRARARTSPSPHFSDIGSILSGADFSFLP
jgi:hypothetical protein